MNTQAHGFTDKRALPQNLRRQQQLDACDHAANNGGVSSPTAMGSWGKHPT